MATARPLTNFGYKPRFSSIKVGSLDDVKTDGVAHDATLRFNSESGMFEARGSQGRVSVAAVDDLGNAALTGAQVVQGLVMRDGRGANYMDVLPTAAEIVAATTNARAGDSFSLAVLNTSTEGGVVELEANVGVTVRGGRSVAAGHVRQFIVLIHDESSGKEAVEFVSLGVTEC